MKKCSQGPHLAGLLAIGIALGLGAPATVLAQAPSPGPAGENLPGDYDAALKDLQAQIAAAVPRLSEPKKAAFQTAREALMKAQADVAAAQAPFDQIEGAEGLVGHRKGKWIGGAEKGIAAAEAALKNATTDAEREAAKKDLAKWQADLEAGRKALVDSLAALDAAKADEAKYKQDKQAAGAALDAAVARELQAAKDLLSEAMPFLSSDKPTVARPQVGHGALARWTPDGWIVNLGAGWGSRESNGVMQMTDADFVLETQVRKFPAGHEQALRAQWAGDALGEPKYVSMQPGSGGLWNVLSQFQKKLVVADTKPVTLAARGTELGEANQSAETMAMALVKAEVSPDDMKIATSPDGVITIPAAACEGGNQLIKSFLGGQQMICAKPFQFEVSVPRAGTYQISARIVAVRDNPPLLLTLNKAAEGIEMSIPYTLGAWQQTPPVTVELKQGGNTLAFTNQTRAFALKDLTLTPVK